MAGVYTEETLQPLNKTQLIKLFLKTQEQTSNTLNTLNEEKNSKNESEIIIVKMLNDAFACRINSAQYLGKYFWVQNRRLQWTG